jgi:hypothetical protein
MTNALVGRSLRWLSLVLYALALLGPGFYFGGSREPWEAYLLLLTGWLGLAYGHFSWLANPAFLIAQLMYRTRDRSLRACTVALLLALSFLLHRTIAVSEAPTYASIVGYGWGYYLWVLSIAVLGASHLVGAEHVRKGNVL